MRQFRPGVSTDSANVGKGGDDTELLRTHKKTIQFQDSQDSDQALVAGWFQKTGIGPQEILAAVVAFIESVIGSR